MLKNPCPLPSFPLLLVAHQLVEHLNLWRLLPDLQSAYRAHHSTETAVLRVMSDILDALDRGDFAVLTLLDLSAAFDTVDHTTLLRRLQITYGITDTALVWFASYLHERKLSVWYRGSCSTISSLLCGIPQGYRSSSFCTRLTYLDSLKVWIFTHTFMRTIHRLRILCSG